MTLALSPGVFMFKCSPPTTRRDALKSVLLLTTIVQFAYFKWFLRSIDQSIQFRLVFKNEMRVFALSTYP